MGFPRGARCPTGVLILTRYPHGNDVLTSAQRRQLHGKSEVACFTRFACAREPRRLRTPIADRAKVEAQLTPLRIHLASTPSGKNFPAESTSYPVSPPTVTKERVTLCPIHPSGKTAEPLTTSSPTVTPVRVMLRTFVP